jgi:hypothetical protein
VTVIYWVAAAAALLSAAEAGGELARDRLPALAAWALSMTALSASLALAAVNPAVLHGESGPAAWACAGLGILGTWGFAEVLSAGRGDVRSVTGIMATPLFGGACAALLLLGLHWTGSHGTADAGRSQLAPIGAQLALLACYAPGLCQVAVLARQRAALTPPSWARTAMRAVCASAVAQFVLTMARSAILVALASGMPAGGSAITVIGVLQGIAVIWGIGALAVGPLLVLVSARCWPWLAYWRLRPMWALLRQAVPDAERPAVRSSRFSIRRRLLRRVTEICDAEHALSAYWREDVAVRALAAARSAGLSVSQEQAVVEAAVVMDAVSARLRGEPPPAVPLQPEWVDEGVGDDLQSEVDRLVEVARAMRRYPLVHELSSPESSSRLLTPLESGSHDAPITRRCCNGSGSGGTPYRTFSPAPAAAIVAPAVRNACGPAA